MNFFSNDLEIVLTIVFVSVFTIYIYNIINKHGKVHLNILNLKVNVQNKDSWSKESNEIGDNTKSVDLDFIIDLYNNKNNYNSVYNICIYKKVKCKYLAIENKYINLNDTVKSISGSSIYEKLKTITFLPYELKEYNVKIKLSKEEFLNLKNEPLYIIYKEGLKTKKYCLNKTILRKK